MYTMAAVIGVWLALFGVNYPELKAQVLNSFTSQNDSSTGSGEQQTGGADTPSDSGSELALPEFCAGIEDLSTVEIHDFGRQDQTTAFIELRKNSGFGRNNYSIDLEPSKYT